MAVEWRNVGSADVPYLGALDCWVATAGGDCVASVWLQNGPEGRLEWQAWAGTSPAVPGLLGSMEAVGSFPNLMAAMAAIEAS